MMDTTDRTHRLGLPYLANDQAQKHVTVNESLRALDALVHTSVASAALDAQPEAPAPGDAYLMTSARSGAAWAGFAEGDLAAFQDGAWAGFAPRPGMTVWVEDEARHRVWTGAEWRETGSGGGTAAPQDRADVFGINASADPTNRLTVKSDAVLHSHDDASGQGTGDARHVINKAGPGATASLLFQSGYAGRAEMGLAGSDDFAVKVSGDGGAFAEAIRIDRDSGSVSLPNTAACPATGAPAAHAFSLYLSGRSSPISVGTSWTRLDGSVLTAADAAQPGVVDGRFTADADSAGLWLLGGVVTFHQLDDAAKAVVGLRVNDEASRFRMLGRGTCGATDLTGFGGSALVRLAPGESVSIWYITTDPTSPSLSYHTGYTTFFGTRVAL